MTPEFGELARVLQAESNLTTPVKEGRNCSTSGVSSQPRLQLSVSLEFLRDQGHRMSSVNVRGQGMRRCI